MIIEDALALALYAFMAGEIYGRTMGAGPHLRKWLVLAFAVFWPLTLVLLGVWWVLWRLRRLLRRP